MSIYTTKIVKPVTQIYNQQPTDILNDNDTSIDCNLNSQRNNAKPIAYVTPIEKISIKDQAIQTDSISIDISSIIDIQDFQRSERLIGKLDIKTLNRTEDCCDLATATSRIKKLEDALRQQLKVNEDIKKLLFASLGEDLAAHFLKLTSDIACFNEKINDLISDKVESTESIDQLSIEANLWKNKFVAGRVLVDELASWKHQLSLRYRESLEALHTLLQERQSLRLYLTMITNELLSLSAHFGFRPQLKAINNTFNLAQAVLKFVKSLKSRIAKGAVWRNQITNEEQFLANLPQFTEGEKLALEVLRNRPNPHADTTGRITASFVSETSKCLESLACHACKNCKGDILVI